MFLRLLKVADQSVFYQEEGFTIYSIKYFGLDFKYFHAILEPREYFHLSIGRSGMNSSLLGVAMLLSKNSNFKRK